MLTWIGIKDEENCTITHGEYKPILPSMTKEFLDKEIKDLEEHFLKELKFIAE